MNVFYVFFQNLYHFAHFYIITYFRNYPFDKQYCNIEIALFQDLWDFVKVEDGNFSYSGPKDLRDYTIRKASIACFTIDVPQLLDS